jgi:hypothetical protein
MELRITNIFRPLSRAAGFFLSELGVSPTAVALSSFVVAIISSALFIFFNKLPLMSVETTVKVAVALIFVNAFLDDVERNVARRSRKKSVFGGPLGTFLGQLSDVFILFGVLLFLALKDTYYNFGRVWVLDLTYIEPGIGGHLALGLAAFLGVLFLRHTAASKKEKGAGLWTRSERMYFYGGFAAVGVFSGPLFSGLLFSGILVLSALIYLSTLRRIVNIGAPSTKSSKLPHKTRRFVSKGFAFIINLLRTALRGVLRIIGVILLGIYLTLEKIYVTLERATNTLKNVKLPKKASKAKTATGPVAASLGADTESQLDTTVEQTSETTIEETTTEELVSPEPLTIEVPPPESDSSYMAGEDMGESMLVEYEPTAKKEGAIVDVINFMLEEGKDLIVVSTQPATTYYKDRFGGLQGIRIINLPDQATMPAKDEIPMTNLEYFSEVFETLTKQHVFLFEPLSNLILNVGVGQAYRFISQTHNRLSSLGVTFIVFMNKEGHDKKDISNFENLFMNIAEIEEDKLKKVR